MSRHRGFVYIIVNLVTGQAYVGKKSLWSRRGRVVRESDWRRYFGSSATLKADVKRLGHDVFERRVLRLCETDREMNYHEEREQFVRDVIHATLPDGSPAFYNGQIAGRWYRR